MNSTEINTLHIRTLLSELIGHVTAKKLFIGYGLFHQNHMFGIYHSGIFYLRAENELSEYLKSRGAVPWAKCTNPRLQASKYYQLPKELTQDKKEYRKLIILSIQQVKNQKRAILFIEKSRLKFLPNLSVKHERLLGKVAINNVEIFNTLGPTVAYVRLRKAGLAVNLSIFWRLLGASKNKHFELFNELEKFHALKSLNLALSNAGLKEINIQKALEI